MDKYDLMYSQLKEEAANAFKNSNSDKFIEDLRNAMKKRVSEMHDKLEKQRKDVIALLHEGKFKKLDNNDIAFSQNKNLGFRDKVKDMIDKLNGLLKLSESQEDIKSLVVGKSISELIRVENNDFTFIQKEKLCSMLSGKSKYEWEAINKSHVARIDLDDKSKLLVDGSSCYNYYLVNQVFTRSSNETEISFETDIIKTDGYFYFGISSTPINYSSCMCCTIANVTYIKSTGYVVSRGCSDDAKLPFSTGSSNTIKIDINFKKNEIQFFVNGQSNGKKYALPDVEAFQIVSGHCNSAKGYIKIN